MVVKKKDEYEPTGLSAMAFELAAKVKPGEKPITQLYGGSSGLATFSDKLNKSTNIGMYTKKADRFPAKMFSQHKPGSAHRMFGVPHGVKLPRTFLQKIVDTPLMEVAHNPTQIGYKQIKVTHKVKARANGLLNAIRLHNR